MAEMSATKCFHCGGWKYVNWFGYESTCVCSYPTIVKEWTK